MASHCTIRGYAPKIPPQISSQIPSWSFFPLSPSCPTVVYKAPASAKSRALLPNLSFPSPGAAGAPLKLSSRETPTHLAGAAAHPRRAQEELPGRAGGGRRGQRESKHPGPGSAAAGSGSSCRTKSPFWKRG